MWCQVFSLSHSIFLFLFLFLCLFLSFISLSTVSSSPAYSSPCNPNLLSSKQKSDSLPKLWRIFFFFFFSISTIQPYNFSHFISLSHPVIVFSPILFRFICLSVCLPSSVIIITTSKKYKISRIKLHFFFHTHHYISYTIFLYFFFHFH